VLIVADRLDTVNGPESKTTRMFRQFARWLRQWELCHVPTASCFLGIFRFCEVLMGISDIVLAYTAIPAAPCNGHQ